MDKIKVVTCGVCNHSDILQKRLNTILSENSDYFLLSVVHDTVSKHMFAILELVSEE